LKVIKAIIIIIHCGRGRNSWLCRAYQARHSEATFQK